MSAIPRILTAVPICDGHDSPIITINLELAHAGAEVIYLGYHCPASAIARAAVQEDVDAIGISSYNGGHVHFFSEVAEHLRARGGGKIPLFGGGGGTITPADEKEMRRSGVSKIYYAGTSLKAIREDVLRRATGYRQSAGKKQAVASRHSDTQLGRVLTRAEGARGKAANAKKDGVFVLGVSGPGGAGKSTLIDEIVFRFLTKFPKDQIAVVANDPSHPDSNGAILGDRATMIYAQNDRVFMRSVATRGHLTGVAGSMPQVLQELRRSGRFRWILVESVGIGQESDPFGLFARPPASLVDEVLLVLSPFYGGRLQLQKIGLLAGAALIAVNKCDHPSARTALSEIQEQVDRNGRDQQIFGTAAARHQDVGVDQLFAALCARESEK